MKSSRYPLYGVAIVVGSGIALWAGIAPFFVLLLLACPLMMFFMMRSGMHGDTHGGPSGSDPSRGATRGSRPARPSDLDGSHERIDHP